MFSPAYSAAHFSWFSSGAPENPGLAVVAVRRAEPQIDDGAEVHRDAEPLEFMGLGATKPDDLLAEVDLTEKSAAQLRHLSGGQKQRLAVACALVGAPELLFLDEPTTGLHPSDVQRLVTQLDGLVELGNTVIVVEHDLDVVAASDYVIDMGLGAGEAGGAVVATGTPAEVSSSTGSRTALYLRRRLGSG